MINKLILGTVQLGLDYGVNNKTGKPSLESAYSILNFAYENGVTTLDTAEAYGNSQEVIGGFLKENPKKTFQIITKLSANTTVSKGHLIDHIRENLRILNVESLHGYLFHNYDCFKRQEYLYQEILSAKKSGIIHQAGISLYTNEEIEDIITNYQEFDFIQIPFNLLDNESKRRTIIEEARKKSIDIHTRSVFLQGLFFAPLDGLSDKLIPLRKYLLKIKKVQNSSQIKTEEMAMQYVLQKDYIDKVLIGVDNVSQLKNNIDICKKETNVSWSKIDNIKVKEEHLLNPSNWH